MKRPPLPYLLLLPLLAVLLFGSCNGGVNHFLFNLGANGRLARFDSLTRERHRLRTLAQQQLRGPARREEISRIEGRIDACAQALLLSDWERRKLLKRRNKIERQRRHRPLPKRPWYMPD